MEILEAFLRENTSQEDKLWVRTVVLEQGPRGRWGGGLAKLSNGRERNHRPTIPQGGTGYWKVFPIGNFPPFLDSGFSWGRIKAPTPIPPFPSSGGCTTISAGIFGRPALQWGLQLLVAKAWPDKIHRNGQHFPMRCWAGHARPFARRQANPRRSAWCPEQRQTPGSCPAGCSAAPASGRTPPPRTRTRPPGPPRTARLRADESGACAFVRIKVRNGREMRGKTTGHINARI